MGFGCEGHGGSLGGQRCNHRNARRLLTFGVCSWTKSICPTQEQPVQSDSLRITALELMLKINLHSNFICNKYITFYT